MDRRLTVRDGNEACADVAYRVSEVISIYPITPASPMGELADAWANQGRPNVFGLVPDVVEMQSEAGAAGAVHGSLLAGALTTTFTASQGLLLMIPNMFKIAGELTPTVFHIAARAIATHALSIFGDHSDVMSARSTGWAMLASSSVQEAQDLALVAHAATLRTRVPVLHFFDGFRTSHEINTVHTLTDDDITALIDRELIRDHRRRGLDPDYPTLRGTAQNPDVFFQAREAANPFYLATPGIVQEMMDRIAERTGRAYKLFDYVGHPEAEYVAVAMGSGTGAAEEAVKALAADGRRVGLVKVRLYRPFDTQSFINALPATTKRVVVLDRTKEPGAPGEPLYQDVTVALAESWQGDGPVPMAIGARFGLSSKEFTPAMAAAVFDEAAAEKPRRRMTVGIIDDVTNLSIRWDPTFLTEGADETRAVFYGLGSDGTVGATKNAAKIIGDYTDLHAQGYFVYDSKKSGAMTISHLRFGPRPINSSYLIQKAGFVACHQHGFLDRVDMLSIADEGATFLLNSPYPAEKVWETLPHEVQTEIIERKLRLFVVPAHAVAAELGLGSRINTVMLPCFFTLSGVLPREQALEAIRDSIRKTYGKRGETIVKRNLEAVERSLDALCEVDVPREATSTRHRRPAVPDSAPDFVKRVTAMMIEGRGDLLPVSALPVDGTFPTATAQFEKRGIAREIPIWEPSLCIDCGLCAMVCPHAAVRTKVFEPGQVNGAIPGFRQKPWKGKEYQGKNLVIQVAPDDCTGCGVCVDVCPARSKESAKLKALNMAPVGDHVDEERRLFDFVLDIPEIDRRDVRLDTVNGSQLLQPLFEFSGACAGCGETPYIKLMSQLFGDRAVVANATGCSSIFGGNLPTTPWTVNDDGRGPAWANSLFEDNAEFGLGMALAVDRKRAYARSLLDRLGGTIGREEVDALLAEVPADEAWVAEQRERVAALKQRLEPLAGGSEDVRDLLALADVLVPRSIWIVGGDGWAYDIGFGGVDHVLTTGRNVNILVLDTEVYSNTGGQASKSTPRAAVAKFASGGKATGKKDLGLAAMSYGNVYVAQIALGANPKQTLKAIREAEAYPGPSLILAYSHCIAHGIDMTTANHHQADAVKCGYWPLYRYDPRHAHEGEHPLQLDSRAPSRPFKEWAMKEARFAMLARTDPERAEHLLDLAQRDIDERWHFYQQMVGVERTVPDQEVLA
ncbi:MAG: pyruvate:ferredoxin (flavodoxin) oxidoreductase [Planctomycetes bacterium]|nr:pyruvate:ferredoxin (flavodoxin) oxidoreductase [Planctomycetota bacterium]